MTALGCDLAPFHGAWAKHRVGISRPCGAREPQPLRLPLVRYAIICENGKSEGLYLGTLVPYITLVIFDLVAFEKRPEFFFE